MDSATPSLPRNIALIVSYDGSSFFGWQHTHTGPSIEKTLEQPLSRILQESISLQAASRTDRGVHADAQCVNFFTHSTFSLAALHKSLNALLPPTIRIMRIREMPPSFHPSLHAIQKTYQYRLSYGEYQHPKERLFSWHIPYVLDIPAIEQALPFFMGKQDFLSFCNYRKNLHYSHTLCTLSALSLSSLGDQRLLLTIQGDRFLYKMVRNIVGTLVHVGRKIILPTAIPAIIAKRSRPAAGMTAPAHGLTLTKVDYCQEYLVCGTISGNLYPLTE